LTSANQNSLRVRKAAPKSGRKRKGKPPVQVTAELLAETPLFSVLDDETRQALAARCQHVDLARGEHLFDGPPIGGDDAPIFFVLFGDVSVHHRQSNAPEATANYLSVGEVCVERLVTDEDTLHLRVTAMCPVRALRIAYRDVNVILRESAVFRDAFSEVIREILRRQRTRFDNTFQQDIARFLVQERLTFAGRVKLKRMDLCIECDGCYRACESRHGTDRLGPSEIKYGLTEVPQNCHNCVVPECMDKCKFGHIGRHPTTGEIVIDDNCIGCTMCSKGCSFGSIRMHPIADLDMEKYFPNRAPDAKGKAIAQKCDNCTDYEDMACISACPTGALFQIDGTDLFNHWEQFTVHERPGFEDVSSPETSADGWRRFWVTLTVVNTLLLGWECFGRHFWPHLTFGQLFYNLGWSETGINPDAPFKPGDFFGHSMGYIAGILMIGTQVYRLRDLIGHTRVLMEAHIWMGVLGAVYAFFHTAFYFSDPIAIATFATMMLAVVTGTIGRYVLYLIPRGRAGTQLELAEVNDRMQEVNRAIEEGFVDTRSGYTAVMRLADLVDKQDQQIDDESVEETRGFIGRFIDLIRNDAQAKRDIESMANEMSGEVREGMKGELVELLREKARLERSVRQHAFLSKVLKAYRVVHVTSSNIMFGALVLHVINALMYQV
jgi:Fe-S-cluster-containing hydrogenase component 2